MKKILTYLVIFLTFLFYPLKAFAVCPVCTVAVAAGLGLAEELGIDDTITGLWIGALGMSLTLWTLNWLNKKNIRFIFREIIILAIYYALIIIPLYWKRYIGHPDHQLWGIDKLTLSITIGSIAFLGISLLYDYLKARNNNKPHFSYQKIVMPIGILLIFSAIFYFVTKG